MQDSAYKTPSHFDLSGLTDIGIRIVLGVFFGLFAAANYTAVVDLWRGTDLAHLDLAGVSHMLSVLSVGAYALMITFLYVVRLRPVNRLAGFWPAATAVLGSFLMYGLLLLKPRNDLSPDVRIFASVMVLGGNILAVYIMTKLGRSFSIFPEGRRLVVTGPYRIVRHPLYIAEAASTLGVMALFLSPVAVVLFIAQAALQLGRIHYEEHVLREAFPEYREYANTTARLIPGVY